MADSKISALTAIDAVAADDLFAIVDDPAGTPVSKKATSSQIKDYIISLANTWTATQTITPAANTNALAVTGHSLTGSNAQSLIDLAGTWNTTGTPTAFKINITDTASNAVSMLMDLQIGGNPYFRVNKPALASFGVQIFTNTYNANTFLRLGGTNNSIVGAASNALGTHYQLIGDTSGSGGPTNLAFGSGAWISWQSTARQDAGSQDLIILRDAANTLALRNGTNANILRVYYTYSGSGSNYQRIALNTGADYGEVAAETGGTGAADLDLRLTPVGTGRVRFGTHSAIAAETVTGYITIKDAGGTSRKIAVVS